MARECGPPSNLRTGPRVARMERSEIRDSRSAHSVSLHAGPGTPSVRLIELGGRKPVAPVAELAGNADRPILRHVPAFGPGKAGQHVRHPLARAGASGLNAAFGCFAGPAFRPDAPARP